MSKRIVLYEEKITPAITEALDSHIKNGRVADIFSEANEKYLFDIPVGLEVKVIENNTKYDVYLRSEIWGSLEIFCGSGIIEEYLVRDSITQSHTILRGIADIVNRSIDNLVYAADIILAQFSDNSALLENLAGSGDSMVRALIKHNKDSSEEAKVLAILRERNQS